MPQNPTHRAFEAKKLISASMPNDISDVDRKVLIAKWEAAAKKRQEAIDKETMIPTKANLILRYELQRFGHHWQGYSLDKRGKRVPLLAAPSLFTSAVDAVADQMTDDAAHGGQR